MYYIGVSLFGMPFWVYSQIVAKNIVEAVNVTWPLEHFTRKEFSCKCGCGLAIVDVELGVILEAVRERFGLTIVSSGTRCKIHNKAVGGASDSFHMKGMAADIYCKGAHARDIFEFLCARFPDRFGFILYGNFVHVDSRYDEIYRDERG